MEMQRTNSTSACASCKHQRKKCTEKCTLAPFFPVERTREFQAVHKVFGVSNVTKIITSLREEDRKVAVDSLVWEALCRQKDPVLGPFGDYRRVCEELRLYKSQYQHFHQVPNQVYKTASTQGLMGWNNNNKIMNKNIGSNNNFHENGNSVVDFCTYGYSPNHHIHQDSEKQRIERENGSVIKPIILPQQHLPNDFSQQYVLTDQYTPLDSKSMESTLWEGSS
ncbi:LOB domain-containing protein 2 [Perilla frutescens var. hirtella]|uniref:LOB domain-containing protein 2 n=1 Tax=Perilla frutescens var. hirtella TaxID=608512 RepID=A0AAD4P433_PERFH|nr:LOB domain-containing protein 2 [Perilla frutescens var. hirtella]